MSSNLPKTAPYQYSVRTTREPAEVLVELSNRRPPGIAVDETGPHYIVFRPERRIRYGGDIAIGLCIAVVLGVLILTAITPWLIILMPLAVLPAVPLWFDQRPDLAVSAMEDDDGAVRVTVHGQASPELAAALDAYLGALPQAPAPNEPMPVGH